MKLCTNSCRYRCKLWRTARRLSACVRKIKVVSYKIPHHSRKSAFTKAVDWFKRFPKLRADSSVQTQQKQRFLVLGVMISMHPW